jgi:hypothetical protein
LVLDICRLLKTLIVVRTRDGGIGRAKIDAANFRTEQPRPAMPQHGESAETMRVVQGYADYGAINL